MFTIVTNPLHVLSTKHQDALWWTLTIICLPDYYFCKRVPNFLQNSDKNYCCCRNPGWHISGPFEETREEVEVVKRQGGKYLSFPLSPSFCRRARLSNKSDVAAWRRWCVGGPYAPHEIGPSVRYVPSCYPVPLWDMWGFSAPRAGGVIVEGPLN